MSHRTLKMTVILLFFCINIFCVCFKHFVLFEVPRKTLFVYFFNFNFFFDWNDMQTDERYVEYFHKTKSLLRITGVVVLNPGVFSFHRHIIHHLYIYICLSLCPYVCIHLYKYPNKFGSGRLFLLASTLLLRLFHSLAECNSNKCVLIRFLLETICECFRCFQYSMHNPWPFPFGTYFHCFDFYSYTNLASRCVCIDSNHFGAPDNHFIRINIQIFNFQYCLHCLSVRFLNHSFSFTIVLCVCVCVYLVIWHVYESLKCVTNF